MSNTSSNDFLDPFDELMETSNIYFISYQDDFQGALVKTSGQRASEVDLINIPKFLNDFFQNLIKAQLFMYHLIDQ